MYKHTKYHDLIVDLTCIMVLNHMYYGVKSHVLWCKITCIMVVNQMYYGGKPQFKTMFTTYLFLESMFLDMFL